MPEMKDLFQSADWTKEKHVPVIDAPASAKKGEFMQITLTVGKEMSRPITTELQIRWIEVYFIAEGDKFPYQLGRYEFTSHGESAAGPNMSTLYTHPRAAVTFKTDKKGVILAAAYCNIHGLWQSSAGLEVV